MDAIIRTMVDFLQDKIPEELVVFIISLFPVVELRGGLVAASLMDIEWWRAFIFCFLGNMLPMPFILLFIRKIFKLMKKWGSLGKVVDKLEQKAHKHSDKVEKYGFWGLFVLVAIPLPGTGGWTGALVAALMDLRMKKALPAIALGVFAAGVIVGTLSYGLVGLLS